MLKFYRAYYTTIVKGYDMYTYCSAVLTENAPINKTIQISWKNLEEIYHDYGPCLAFNIWNFKRGRCISFFHSELRNRKTWDIKEWKENQLDIILNIKYEEYTPSINEVLKWHDGEKAIQYLIERGLTITK